MEYTKREARMSESAPMYVYATENVSAYYKFLKLKNKEILTICGSGDQVLNALYFEAKEVFAFDLNKKAKFITTLKIAALSHLDYAEFLKFFGEDKPNIGFDYKIYKKFRNKLESQTRSFFDRLYKKFDYN
jgi:S-adenosylmethionine:diacylglycerol 3-amino-3-carboxypropyl transferase